MAATPVIERSPDVISRTLAGDDGAVLLHLGTGQYHTLNPVGSRIWELLESPLTVDELCRRLAEEFEANQEALVQDIQTFIQELLDRNLIKRSSNQ
jgi:PqqD family protein of HPr-rel-A system